MLNRIDCTAPKLMPTSLAMLRRSPLLSHISSMCTTLTFLSAVASLGQPDRPSSSTISLPLLNSAAYSFNCAIGRRQDPKGFLHEVLMNFLGRYSILTEVLDNRSDFKCLHYANVSYPPLLGSPKKYPHTLI